MPLSLDVDTPVDLGASTANRLTEPFDEPIAQPIELYDNTLREGEQPPGVHFRDRDKLVIAEALDELGVHWANVGFPAVSEDERRVVERIAGAGLRMKTAALARMLPADIDLTADTGVDMISLFIAGSDTHLEHKYRLDVAGMLARIETSVARAKASGRRVSFTAEDGSRTPFPRLARMLQVAEDAGADYLCVADTVGVLTPLSTHRVVRALRACVAGPIGVHFHDDLGLALANTLAALQAGAQLAHVTINGVGERAGNTCLEELAVLLRVKYGRDLGLALEGLHVLSALVHRASGTAPPAHKAVTGRWSFTHESGIHVAGILAEPETYQPYDPRLVGRRHEIAFGKHSGVRSVRYLAERHGVELDDQGCRDVLALLKRHIGPAASADPAPDQAGDAAPSQTGPIDEARVLGWIQDRAASAPDAEEAPK